MRLTGMLRSDGDLNDGLDGPLVTWSQQKEHV